MATKTLHVPRAYIGVLPVVQQLLDILSDNRRFCVICRNDFEVANAIAIFGCCGLFYHLECASKWLNMPSYGQTDTWPLYATCIPCTARWDRSTLNAYFPPDKLAERIALMAVQQSVVNVPAGIPPADASLVDAVTYYGRLGLGVILSEMVGLEPAPTKEEDVPSLLDILIERFQHRVRNTDPHFD